MTKEELMDSIGTVLDLLDAVPDGTRILSATLQAPYINSDRHTVSLHIMDNIDTVAHRLGLTVNTRDDIYPDVRELTVCRGGFVITQLVDKESRPQ